jgi:hypothetical protein
MKVLSTTSIVQVSQNHVVTTFVSNNKELFCLLCTVRLNQKLTPFCSVDIKHHRSVEPSPDTSNLQAFKFNLFTICLIIYIIYTSNKNIMKSAFIAQWDNWGHTSLSQKCHCVQSWVHQTRETPERNDKGRPEPVSLLKLPQDGPIRTEANKNRGRLAEIQMKTEANWRGNFAYTLKCSCDE